MALQKSRKLEEVVAVVYGANTGIMFAYTEDEIDVIVDMYESKGYKAYVFRKEVKDDSTQTS